MHYVKENITYRVSDMHYIGPIVTNCRSRLNEHITY